MPTTSSDIVIQYPASSLYLDEERESILRKLSRLRAMTPSDEEPEHYRFSVVVLNQNEEPDRDSILGKLRRLKSIVPEDDPSPLNVSKTILESGEGLTSLEEQRARILRILARLKG